MDKFDFNDLFKKQKEVEEIQQEDKPIKEKTTQKRKSTQCLELPLKYEMRRAFSEVQLLNLDIELKENYSYNFITAGDVDQLSYLQFILRKVKKLDYLLFSTWCMSPTDIKQIDLWLQEKKLKKVDAYLGEIFPSSYPQEYSQIKQMYEKHKCGRIAIFRNHSKIFAGYNKDFYFSVQTSANINTNPRCENGCITINKDLFHFYKDYFDKINSIL